MEDSASLIFYRKLYKNYVYMIIVFVKFYEIQISRAIIIIVL